MLMRYFSKCSDCTGPLTTLLIDADSVFIKLCKNLFQVDERQIPHLEKRDKIFAHHAQRSRKYRFDP